MILILEDTELGTDLDCAGFTLRNIKEMTPVPPGLVARYDPGLDDGRVPLPESVTDLSVNAVAAIVQDKLNLNGDMPTDWIGSGTGQAAPGDMVELLAHKGVSNGYSGLDASGRVPSSNVPTGAGAGTVNSIGLLLPPELDVNSPITEAGAFAATWNDAPDGSWFGASGFPGLDSVLRPSFVTSQLPLDLVPPLSADKFTSGVFPTEVLPVAEPGFPGVIPDPGMFGLKTDYLGRDMQWHRMATDIPYQPFCPMPMIKLDSWTKDDVTITIRAPLRGASLFYQVGNIAPFVLGKVEHHEDLINDPHDTIKVHEGDQITAYVSKAGYNDSEMAFWVVKTPDSLVH